MENALNPCSIDGCEKPIFRKSWCSMHYGRWKRNGDPFACRTPWGEPFAFVEKALASSTDDCVLWPFAISSNGYGSYYFERRYTRPHIVVCALAHGEKPFKEAEAAHSCGVRHCINPRHLRWATRAENESDKAAHGTRVSGREAITRAKLTEEEVIRLMTLIDSTSRKEISQMFGISHGQVCAIYAGKKWKFLQHHRSKANPDKRSNP